jgi:hypothetical protein
MSGTFRLDFQCLLLLQECLDHQDSFLRHVLRLLVITFPIPSHSDMETQQIRFELASSHSFTK